MEREYAGSGAFGRFLADFQKSGLNRLFTVVSRSALARQRDRLGALTDCIAPDAVFADFESNPSLESVQHGRERCRRFGPDAILAIGGGSSIDVAKSIKHEFPSPELPLIVIPTTAGSGSEATHFAVYYRGNEKISLVHPHLLPDTAVVDPVFSRDMPPPLAAATGFDALSQAVESLWAFGATDASRKFADRAIRLLLPNIAQAVNCPDDEAQTAMTLGANLAGKAINISKTTAPHALSYFLTKRYGIPHGQAAALFMPYFFIINAGEPGSVFDRHTAGGCSAAMTRILRLFDCLSPRDGAAKWIRLMAECGLASMLSELGLDSPESLREIFANMNAERLSNNPVRFRVGDIEWCVQQVREWGRSWANHR